MNKVVTTTTRTMTGQGSYPTVGDLRTFVNGLPDEAAVTMRVHDDQREGSSWALSADFEPKIMGNHIIPGHNGINV